MDEPLKGLKFMSTKWTNPTRVKNLYKSTKWTDPVRDQDPCPQSGRTQLRSNNLHKSTKWTNPTRNQIRVHKMDEPLEGLRFMSTKWTDLTRFKKPT